MAADSELEHLAARHIQNMSEAEHLEPHWGYYDRSIPCTNDPGSCAYLDQVYGSHDLGMLYSGILWATIGGILFIWAIGRRIWPSTPADPTARGSNVGEKSSIRRLGRAIATHSRHYLLPDAARPIFGRTTRLQVLILTALAGYLLIWSFIGIAYSIWITPVADSPGLYNVRSSLGPWSDRIGILAYALTPLSILLGSRESILSLLTGVPYQSFNFLHRWLGYIIVLQGSLHMIGWTVIEVRLYQPQPQTALKWICELYMVWGVVAMILLLLLFALSTPWGIRLTGYEFFRKAHYVLAMVYIGACWGHWKQLNCFLIPSLVIWFLDRGVRLVRTGLIHYQYLPDGSMGFQAAHASLTHFPDAEHGDAVRLDFTHPQDAWKIGQHFYLCFAECSIWQSHPFTPLNLPRVQDGVVSHSYILRAKKGETKKVADLAFQKLSKSTTATTPLILTGPYGDSIAETLTRDTNVLCVAGGTGIAYVLPVLLSLAQQPATRDRKIQLVWAIRRKEDMRWVERELDALQKTAGSHQVVVNIYVTREAGSRNPSVHSSSEKGQDDDDVMTVKETGTTTTTTTIGGCCSAAADGTRDAAAAASIDVKRIGGGEEGFDRHPDLRKLVHGFVENTVRGPTRVYASGPGGMISDLRAIVAACSSGGKVWRGDERFDVGLTCDDRLEW
ncbi:ferric reductase like transmembrane component-domain-containing protein [Biscogniauxia mediterranea]|nr:ferric reductase like transmembrane component-domain-containing protein [Biscogniauxia mediterranea]